MDPATVREAMTRFSKEVMPPWSVRQHGRNTMDEAPYWSATCWVVVVACIAGLAHGAPLRRCRGWHWTGLAGRGMGGLPSAAGGDRRGEMGGAGGWTVHAGVSTSLGEHISAARHSAGAIHTSPLGPF